jgi:DNA modification methylase
LPWHMLKGEFQDTCRSIPDGSVDAIITDPPYSRRFLHLYSDLAALAFRALKPGGFCFVMLGNYTLPEALPLLCPPLKFCWLLAAFYLDGCNRTEVNFPFRIVNCWKPILFLRKPPVAKPTGGYRVDALISKEKEKRLHSWQQPESVFYELLRLYTEPDWLVLDPMAGTGTTGVAAFKLGRRFIGVEVDPEIHQLAVERLSQLEPMSSLEEVLNVRNAIPGV